MGPKNAKWIIKSKQSIRDHMCVTLIRSLVTDVHSGGASEPAGRPARVAPPNKELARAMVVVDGGGDGGAYDGDHDGKDYDNNGGDSVVTEQ